jgi:hypothetical protein
MKIISVNQRKGPHPKLPEVLVCYNFVKGLTDEEEDRFLSTEEDLFAIGTITLHGDLVGTRSERANPSSYPKHFSTYTKENIVVDETLVKTKVQDMRIAAWTLLDKEQVRLLNVGTETEPTYLKVNTHLDQALAQEAEELFWEYKDVFAWTYKDLKGIPPSVALHRIELDKDVPPAHQAHYRMNPNNANIIKQDVDKFLKAGFIKPVEEATWLSPIVIVPKKNGKLRICIDYRKLNAATKKDPYPLPFTEEVLDAMAGHAMYTFLDGHSGYYQI